MNSSNKKSVVIQPADPAAIQSLAQQGRLYAVLDSCNQPLVLEKSRQCAGAMRSLFKNQAAEEHKDFAPYLFETDQILVDWIHKALAGTHFGIFIETHLDLTVLRSHLRKFLLVEGENDRRLYFRFYDPRVIGGFLATADAEIAQRFFGPIHSFFFVDQEEQLMQIKLSESAKETQPGSSSSKIKVTKKHMLAMAERSKLIFGKRLQEHLSKSLPGKQIEISDSVLETKIKNGILNSEYYALTTEADIAKYVELMCIGFPNSNEADDSPEIRSLMYDRRMGIPERLKKLEEMVLGMQGAGVPP